MVTVFWLFMYRDITRFSAEDEQLANFDASALSAFTPGTVSGRAHLVHFWNPDCTCNRFNRSHVLDLIDDYQRRGVSFSLAVPHERHQEDALLAFPMVKDVYVAADIDSISSPASAVFNMFGQLTYFGPYSEGAFCAAGKGAPVEQILNELLDEGNTTPWLNLSAIGCYCPWPTNT